MINSCYFTYKAVNEPDWTETFLGNDYMVYANECLYKNSKGNLVGLLPDKQQADFKQFEQMITGLDVDLSVIKMTNDGVPALQDYRNDLIKKYESYELNDFIKSEAENTPDIQITRGNGIIGCTNDEWQLSASKCKFPASTAQTGETDHLKDNLCIVVPTFTPTTLNVRYSDPNAQCANAAINIYASLKKCVNQHGSLLSSITNDLYKRDEAKQNPISPSVNELQHTLYTALLGSNQELKKIQGGLKETLQFINSEKGGLNTLMNCKVVRRESLMLMGNFCYDFAIHFSNLSILLAILLGPLIFLMAICVCYSASKTQDIIIEDKIEKQAEIDAYQYM